MSSPVDIQTEHVLRDGTRVHVRPGRVDDRDRVAAMWERLSPETIRYRFGGMLKLDERRLEELLGVGDANRSTLVATLGRRERERIIALAQLVVLPEEPGTAEFGALVEDEHQGRGVGTVLLRELAVIARARRVERLRGDVAADNVRMLRIIRDLGLEVEQHLDGPTVQAVFDVRPTDRYLAAVAEAEKESARNALDRFLRPARVAVVGASRDPSAIGGLVFANVLEGGFRGTVYPVNRSADAVHSVAAYPSLSDCPRVPDVVFVCVPAGAAVDVVDEAGTLGVRAVCVISAGFAETGPEGAALQEELVARARAHGLRLVGPNCMGMLSGTEDVRMNATFSRVFPRPGPLSFLSQSGALGLSVLERFEQLGLGIASFVSVGNKVDISGNDLLLYWEDDPQTEVILLYLESFGNPRRFARIARRIGRKKPIVAVKAGRSVSGQRAASSHTAALAAGDVAVDALFRQAGVIRTGTLEELFNVAGVLATQPVPRGRRVAILTNGGGPGILAADACEANGLVVPALGDGVESRLRKVLPPAAGTTNPVDLIASSTAEQYREAIEIVGNSGEVDALLVIFIPPFITRAEDVAAAIITARDRVDASVPIVTVFMGGGDVPGELALARIPNFPFPEDATRAMGHVATYGSWLGRPEGAVVRPKDVDKPQVRSVVDRVLADQAEGSWLTADETTRFLSCYGVTLARSEVVATPDEAAAAQQRLQSTVAVKLAAPVHKADVGGVRLRVDGPEQAAEAVREIDGALRERGLEQHAGQYLVQEMVADGVEVVVGVTHDRLFGPLVMVGLGGTLVELIHDVSVRITPLTDIDVDEMLRDLRTYPLLTGYRGSRPADVDALRDLLFRVNTLVEDVPEIAEMDLNPVFVRHQGIAVVDARIRVAPVPRR